jgi:hypothetical protein
VVGVIGHAVMQRHLDVGAPEVAVADALHIDAGLLPIRQFNERICQTRAFADARDDPRDRDLTEQSFREMVPPRVYGILAGYEDQNDHDTLRADTVFLQK